MTAHFFHLNSSTSAYTTAMDQRCFFIRGTFGSGLNPAPVPDNENESMHTAMIDGTPLVEFANHYRLVLLDKVAHDMVKCHYSMHEMSEHNAFGVYNSDSHIIYKQLCDLVKSLDTQYSCKQYVIYTWYDLYGGASNPTVPIPITNNLASWYSDAFMSYNRVNQPISVFIGKRGDLVETSMTPGQLIALNLHPTLMIEEMNGMENSSTQILINQLNGNIDHASSRNTPANIKRIEKAINRIPDDASMWIISIHNAHISPKVIIEHLRLFPSLISPVQLAIYENVVVDESAITYDDGPDGTIYADD